MSVLSDFNPDPVIKESYPDSERDPSDTQLRERELTFGEKLVGLNFNPSNDDKVGKAKRLCADLADLVYNNDAAIGTEPPTYLYNLIKGKALGEILNAQMNVVKVLTLKY
jgi:hypothetical protein